ncbi:MAG: hypothetical protein CMF80_07005 [Candidatus Marinimicrobia bacterium]|nr:hypothetical protein [Candidatus Neomarinimicrobiota bacterium]|tara:strand:+ start:662 stop:1105 length:444 start_codon:yes stop_codon:yes gene_type:complete
MNNLVIDEKSILNAFCKNYKEWMEWTVSLFKEENNKTHKTIRGGCELVCNFIKLNPILFITGYYKQIYARYKKYIDDGDFNFFAEKDYSWDIEDGALVNAKKALETIHTIRKELHKFSDHVKSRWMKYVKTVSKLSLLYVIKKAQKE